MLKGCGPLFGRSFRSGGGWPTIRPLTIAGPWSIIIGRFTTPPRNLSSDRKCSMNSFLENMENWRKTLEIRGGNRSKICCRKEKYVENYSWWPEPENLIHLLALFHRFNISHNWLRACISTVVVTPSSQSPAKGGKRGEKVKGGLSPEHWSRCHGPHLGDLRNSTHRKVRISRLLLYPLVWIKYVVVIYNNPPPKKVEFESWESRDWNVKKRNNKH